MTTAQGPFLAAVLLLVSSGLHCTSLLPACPESCSCQRAPLLNCSSSGLSFVPQHTQDSFTELDLSHNLLESVTLGRPHYNLRNVWLGNNSITHLSLCIERNMGSHYVRGRHLYRLRPWGKRGCVSWAPTLHLLSVERNQLEQLPDGLEGSESLQVLQLSFNKISTLKPADLAHLRQLKELHLQHNLIKSLHPQMFQDLAQLQVIDLSFNMLTSLHPLMYLSLRNIGADVRLGGNRWQCDCSMRSVRRRMAYDSSRGLQAWSVVCTSPSILSGRDLLQLEDNDLNCFSTENRPELQQDVTVYSGSKILLSCSAQDSVWWTPNGQASLSQPQADLLISDITERDTGLYVCVSEDHKVVSVFNLQISQIEGTRRKTRSLPRTSGQIIPQGTLNRIGQERNQRATQSNLALAVCLSVFITFLIAFILGVLARPCIDVLWRRVTNRKSSSATNSVSSVEQRQYDNEAYSNGEEPEQIGPHRERRVTFSTVDFREDSNVQYYDTVASGDQESINNDAVIECEAAEAENNTHTAEDSQTENSLRQSSLEDNQKDGRDLSGVTDAGHTNTEFEHIPDPDGLEERRSLSSCSDSSLSNKVFNEDQKTQQDHTTSKSPQLAEDSVQQRVDFSTAIKVEVPQISKEGSSEIHGFSSEPFTDWSPHTCTTNLKDPDLWQENGEQFEFSDSVPSTSGRSSSSSSFNDSKLTVAPTSDTQRRDDMSSSSSYVSVDEPTQYTVNSDQEEEDIESNHNKPVNNFRHDTLRPAVRPEHSSSHSSDSDGEDYKVKHEPQKGEGKDESISVADKQSSSMVTREWETREKAEPMPRTKWHGTSLGVTSHSKSPHSKAPSPPEAYSSSSSSESEAEITDLKVEHNTGRVNEAQMLSTDLDHQCIPQIKKGLNIKAPLPASDSSSSDDSTDETTDHMQNQKHGEMDVTRFQLQESHMIKPDSDTRWPTLDLTHIPRTTRRLDIKGLSPASESSSSSDSEDEITHHAAKGRPGKEGSHDPHTSAIDLEYIPRVKRHLDIKAPSPPPDLSSNNEAVEEKVSQINKHEQEGVHVSRLPFQKSQAESHDPETQWPALDLGPTMRIKRRLDIKEPSPPPDSSSNSDSEDETANYKKKQEKRDTLIAKLPIKVSQTTDHDPKTQWPALDLEHIPHIKRRLDIKAPSPPADSSSNSEIVEEKNAQIKKHEQGDLHVSRLPFQESQAESPGPETGWPLLDLGHIMCIKRRLDIQAPSSPPDSSSNSDSEGETINHIKKQEQEQTHIEKLPIKVSQTTDHDPKTQWPALDLGHTTRIKRRLDIKAPSPDCDSSSSSDSEDETTHHTEKPRKVDTAELALQNSQTVSHDLDTSWPALDLGHIPHIKRRLDIKAPSPPADSSSNSEIVEEKIAQIKKHEQGDLQVSRLPFQDSQDKSHDPEKQWPLLDLEHTMRIKRRLDIQAPSSPPDSSSSSDSEGETINHIKKQEQEQTHIEKLPIKVSQTTDHDPKTQWPALDLGHTTRIKRRLDIKAPSPDCDSSSSSDSEDETTHHTEKPRKMDTAELALQNSQTVSHDLDTSWPALDLEHIPHIKRRLDIKAPSPPADSSSNSKIVEEKIAQIKKHEQGDLQVSRLPFQDSQDESHDPEKWWPLLDLEYTMRIKRRLDIKTPSLASDSSSSSDSEGETINHIKKQEQEQTHIEKLPIKVSQTTDHDPKTQWPALDLGHTTCIKRRLDIKAPSPDCDSSSSSDSEDETTHHTEKPRKVDTAELALQNSQTVSHDLETSWPALDLGHIPHIKRRLDIKAPSPPADSSSNSEIVEEKIAQIKKHEQGDLHVSRLPFQESQGESPGPETGWPLLDLEHIMGIKRRLDIKASSPDSDSSNSEDETTNHIKKQWQGKTDMTMPQVTISQTVSHDKEKPWPALDLEQTTRIKRRLDIKAPSPASESSQSSDENESGTTNVSGVHTSVRTDVGITSHQPPSQPADYCSSNSDNDSRLSSHTVKHERDKGDAGITNHRQQTKLHKPSPGLPYANRHLYMKVPSPQPDPVLSSVFLGSQESESNSFRSDSEDENRDHIKIGLGVSAKATGKEFIRSPKTPVINISHSPKAVHNIKLEKYTVIKDEVGDKRSDNISTTPEINPELESRWATMNLGISRFRKRLEISQSRTIEPPDLPSSPPPDSPTSSSNESGTGSTSSRTRRNRRGVGMQGMIDTESSLTSENKPVNALSLKGQDDISGKSVEVKERPTKGYRLPTTEEKSKTNTMLTGFGIPHRRYLDIKVSEKAHATPPLRQLSDSTSSSENEDALTEHAGKGWRRPVVTDKETSQKHSSLYVAQAGNIILDQSPSQTEEVERKAGVELKSQTKVGEESDAFEWPRLNLTNIPHIRRALDIRAPLQRKASSNSNSENETIDRSVPDLSHIPRVKTRLNFKAPLPEPSNSQSSCSESENEVTNMSGMPDDDCLITYKRLIMKPLSTPSDSSSLSGQTIHYANQRHMGVEMRTHEGQSHSVPRNEPLAPRTVPSISFDDVVKKSIEKSRYTTDVDLPPEIRWTGIGRQLSDLSISSSRRHLDVGLSPRQQPPPAETELSQSADLPLMHENSSLSAKSVYLTSSRALDKFENSSGSPNEILRTVFEDKIERKGLNALKLLSSKRQKWDKDDNLHRGASPLFDDHGSQGDTSFDYCRSEEDIKPLGKQPLTQAHFSSTLVGERRPTDFLYSTPHYRSHDIEDIQPLQETPPPISATPPPDETIGLTWSSPQSSKKGLEGSRSYLEQSKNLGAYFDSLNTNITDV